jgi:hypothetical protein
MILGAARSNDRSARIGWSVTNGTRVDPRGFMDAYGSGTWVRTHDVWVLREGHDMVCMLLIGCRVRIC